MLQLRIEQPPQTLREIALERMRGAIMAGHFQSSERLVERSLCDQLGVSRSVVREVIRTLEAEGLVEIVVHKGPIVAPLDWERARQIYDIRLLLEEHAAAACAERADAATKTRLKAALKDLKAAHSIGEITALIAATTSFYKVIFAAAGHDVAWEVVQRLNGRISRLRAMTLSTKDRHVSGHARMTRICEAIVSNDPVTAAKAVRDHLAEASAIARRLFEEDRSGDKTTKVPKMAKRIL